MGPFFCIRFYKILVIVIVMLVCFKEIFILINFLRRERKLYSLCPKINDIILT
jgi:hypothetical protein